MGAGPGRIDERFSANRARGFGAERTTAIAAAAREHTAAFAESVPPYGTRKSYAIPLAEMFGFAFLLNQLNRHTDGTDFDSNLSTIRRETAAGLISPSTAFNRLAFGDRFKELFPANDPVYFSRLQIGYSGTVQSNAGASATDLQRNEALVNYAIDYGLPGKRGYTYDRPFDYFNLEATASSANGAENLLTRGLLLGRDCEAGDDYRGVWGLYGIYDYIAPQTFRVSSTAAALGTTAQWRPADAFAVQGTALIGAGYMAVGTTHSTAEDDYHYGVSPQGLLALRFIFGDRAALDLTAREYFVSDVAAASRGGHDNIVRLDASFTVRVHARHGLSLRYLLNRRDAFYPDVGDSSQTRGTIGLFYTYLGHDRFGLVD